MKHLILGFLLLTSLTSYAEETVVHNTCFMHGDFKNRDIPQLNSEITNYLTNKKNWSVIYMDFNALTVWDLVEGDYYMQMSYGANAYDFQFKLDTARLVKHPTKYLRAVPFLQKDYSLSVSDIFNSDSISERIEKRPKKYMRKLIRKIFKYVPKCELKR